MPGADTQKEIGFRELLRQGEKEEEGEREIESPWGPIRGSSEGRWHLTGSVFFSQSLASYPLLYWSQ